MSEPREQCESIMRDTTPPRRFVCVMEGGHDGPHRAPLFDGGGEAMWTDDGAEKSVAVAAGHHEETRT